MKINEDYKWVDDGVVTLGTFFHLENALNYCYAHNLEVATIDKERMIIWVE